MKKIILLSVSISVLSLTVFAQPEVPNGDFEDWSMGSPDEWSDSNILGPESITEVSGVSGSACQGAVVQSAFGMELAPPLLSSLPGGLTYIPIDQEYPSIKFDYTFTSAGGDIFIATAIAYNESNQATGSGSVVLPASGSFTEGVIPISYFGDNTSRLNIVFTISDDDGGALNDGSLFVLDNVEISNDVVNVQEEGKLASNSFDMIYPNPSNGVISIQFNAEKAGDTSFEILDLSGRIVYSARRQFGAGENLHVVHVENLPQGLYLMRLNMGTDVFTKRLKIIK